MPGFLFSKTTGIKFSMNYHLLCMQQSNHNISFLQFLGLYFVRYFNYGYLFFAGAGLTASVGIVMWNMDLPFILRISIAIAAGIAALICSFMFVNIISTTYTKYRYYKISWYRIKNKGYNEKYFMFEMHEPCFRLMIKDILRRSGFSDEYNQLKKDMSPDNTRIQDAKDRLLASLYNEENSMTESKGDPNGKRIQSS